MGLNKIDKRDTALIPLVLVNPYDQRESSRLPYKGQTIYQAKMEAMQRISESSPPAKITYKIDSSIVSFYTTWAKSKDYISDSTE